MLPRAGRTATGIAGQNVTAANQVLRRGTESIPRPTVAKYCGAAGREPQSISFLASVRQPKRERFWRAPAEMQSAIAQKLRHGERRAVRLRWRGGIRASWQPGGNAIPNPLP